MEEQKEELEVLRSIYGEEVLFLNENTHSGRFLAHPVLPQPFTILLQPQGGRKQELEVKFLPPIVLHFKLVPGYPSKRSPAFVLSCKWLTRLQLTLLCERLDELWRESQPEVVLFRWAQFLQEDALGHLDIHTQLDISPLVTSINQGNTGSLAHALKRMSSVSSEDDDQETQEAAKSNFNTAPKTRRALDIVVAHIKENENREQRPMGRGRSRRPRGGAQGQEPGADPADVGDFVLSTNEILQKLKIDVNVLSEEADYRAVVDLKPGAQLLPIIMDFNEAKQREEFNKEWFSCKVCLSENPGYQCLQFVSCHHVFCKGCMQVYFEVQIKEGNVRLLTCPEEKCSSQATPAQVFELVGMELYDRYDRMLLESSLATMGDLTYCPRKSCQFLVIKDHSENYGMCDRCLFVFCHFCRKTYHGVAPCRFRLEEKSQIITDYQQGDSSKKLELEKRYGKKQLLTMIDEAMSEKWLKDCTKKCPRCAASIQKIDGCNKMVCWRCNTFFCWLCMSKLDTASPYVHFNEPNSKCFNLLFEGAQDVEDAEDWEFGQFV